MDSTPENQTTSSNQSTDSNAINPWQYKPWWCQPWSILLTGCGLISGSWLLLHRLWLTILVAIPLMAWMGFFLLVWPRLMQEYLRSQPGTMPPEIR